MRTGKVRAWQCAWVQVPNVPLLRLVSKPAVQSRHASESACGAYVPEGHDSQDSSLYTKVPAGQSAWREAGVEGE